MYLTQQPDELAYHSVPRSMNNGIPLSYEAQHPGILYDEHDRPYFDRGSASNGDWRQYIVGNQVEEPVFVPFAVSTSVPQDLGGSPYEYRNALFRSQTPVLMSSGRNSARNTPRETPELDATSVDFRVTPAKKKRTAKPREKPKRAQLQQPLSELTKHLTHVPIKDMGAWVNRPAEERHGERRGDGQIKRPSNSFMLYRSAYTERTRELEQNSNHQDISSIAGASWKIETPEVKGQYEEWARLERENHQLAFPDYKFQPQSQAVKDRKRKQLTDEFSEDATDDDDPSYRQHRGKSSTPSRSIREGKKSRPNYREYSGSPSFGSSDEVHTPDSLFSLEGPNSSYFGSVGAGKPIPTAVDRGNHPNGYYITSHPAEGSYSDFSPFDSDGALDDTSLFPTDEQATYSSIPMGLPGADDDLLSGLRGDSMFAGDHSHLNSELDFAPSSLRSDDLLGAHDDVHYQLNHFDHDAQF